MKSKLDLAHEFYLEKLRLDQYVTEAIAWEYAEKMYQEMEDNSPKWNIITEYPEYDVTREYLPEALVKYNGVVMTADEAINLHNTDTFQVDWSVAPDWSNWWAMDKDGKPYWYKEIPVLNHEYSVFLRASLDLEYVEAPSFNYKGNWKESLQERPTGENK